jgi:transposase
MHKVGETDKKPATIQPRGEPMSEQLPCVGIDLAQTKVDVVIWREPHAPHKVFAYTSEGLAQLQGWLRSAGLVRAHICMEASGTLADEIATTLHDAGHRVSVINPALLKSFRQTTMTRTKTDKQDALLLAQYCHLHRPAAWQPPAPALRELQALVRRLEALQAMRQQERNRLSSGTRSEQVTDSLQRIINLMDSEIERVQQLIRQHINQNPDLKQQHELLCSIPGIGNTTADTLLAECGNFDNYDSARQLAAQAGLTPRHFQSGTSVRGKPHLAKTGSARLRKALYMPALVAKRFNPLVRSFCERLRQHGKHPMAVLGAAMRKLLHIVFGVLRTRKPFDPNLLSTRAVSA